MARFSDLDISKDSREEVWKEFCNLISKLKRTDEVRFFLSDLLNRQERLMLVRRVHIAALLEAGYTYREIREIIGVGKQTIARVHRWLNFGRDGYRRIIKLISEQDPRILRRRLERLYHRS